MSSIIAVVFGPRRQRWSACRAGSATRFRTGPIAPIIGGVGIVRLAHDDYPLTGGIPRTAIELGDGMRALRTRGLRAIEQDQIRGLGKIGSQGHVYAVVLSKSTLSRYELGNLPPLELAEHLDQLYGADGWIELGLRTLWRSRWRPWSGTSALPECQHFIAWAASYAGPVWIKIVPASPNVGQEHRLALRWGPWRHDVWARLDKNGVTLTTGKARDAGGIAVTFSIASDKKVHVLHGAGQDLHGEEELDIREGWLRS